MVRPTGREIIVVPRVLAGVLALLLGGPAAWAGDACQPETLHGRLSQHQGLTVLELWGPPEQAGYAHGYLLAERIVRLMDDYLLSDRVVPNIAMYEAVLVPAVRRQFVWQEAYERELRAMCRGMRDRLGAEGFRSRKLERAFRVEDLMVANALADWHSMMCSTFSAWGALTHDGQTITARNLDFNFTGEMPKAQIVLVYRGEGQRRAWIGVTWLGAVGVYTAMNADGVTMLMHDSNGLPASYSSGFTPRSLALREALETASGDSFLADVRAVFQRRRVMVGNNVHVSRPRRGSAPPAVVFEYDANERDQGVTLRLPEHNSDQLADALCCTNHMRLRREPVQTRSGRYAHLSQRLSGMAAAGEKLDAAGAMQLIHEVRWEVPTMHSVVFEPARRVLHVHIPTSSVQVVEFRLDEWLKQRGDEVTSPADRAEKGKP